MLPSIGVCSVFSHHKVSWADILYVWSSAALSLIIQETLTCFHHMLWNLFPVRYLVSIRVLALQENHYERCGIQSFLLKMLWGHALTLPLKPGPFPLVVSNPPLRANPFSSSHLLELGWIYLKLSTGPTRLTSKLQNCNSFLRIYLYFIWKFINISYYNTIEIVLLFDYNYPTPFVEKLNEDVTLY